MTDKVDEELAAFLDGAMSEAEAAAFEARLSSDAELAAKAERWLANDHRVAAAFAPLAFAPVEPELLQRMGLSDLTTVLAAPEAANDNPPWWRRHALPLGGALAASLAAIFLLTPQSDQSPRRDLAFALETGRSLTPVQLEDGGTVTPTLTVKVADGRWCREYRQASTVGLACRESGTWKVEARGSGKGPADGSTIAVASGADASPLDAAFTRLRSSDPVNGDEEAQLIAHGWPAE